MSSTLERTSTSTARRGRLEVARKDIVFHNLDPFHVLIEVTLRHRGEEPSLPTVAVLQAAKLGAFLPWQPLATVPVPSISPGARHTLSLVARVPEARPTGDLGRIPPGPPSIALGSPAWDAGRLAAETELWLDFLAAHLVQEGTQVGPKEKELARAIMAHVNMAPSLLPLSHLGLPGSDLSRWVGNIKVLVHEKSVERHVATGVKVQPGVIHTASFAVGTGDDMYRFHLEGEGLLWKPRLCRPGDCAPTAGNVPGVAPDIPVDRWVRFLGTVSLCLVFHPPREARLGNLEVHVERRSTGERAIVEFGFVGDGSAAPEAMA